MWRLTTPLNVVANTGSELQDHRDRASAPVTLDDERKDRQGVLHDQTNPHQQHTGISGQAAAITGPCQQGKPGSRHRDRNDAWHLVHERLLAVQETDLASASSPGWWSCGICGRPHHSRERLNHGAGGTRTHDLRFRKPSLYPAELQPLQRSLWGLKAGEVIAIGTAFGCDPVEESPGSPMARLAG